MKKTICLIGFLGIVFVPESFGAMFYQMEREQCNRVENATFNVCRPTQIETECSVEAQTLCPGYGGDASIN